MMFVKNYKKQYKKYELFDAEEIMDHIINYL